MILNKFNLDFQWPTFEPFLFCVHHYDHYPEGNGNYGPDKKFLAGRNIGQDFVEKDGFRMYHGKNIPGFPVHPHRGFETVTIVRKGYVDHADSLGAAGRYGQGDVQWMTAGRGVQHSEMFPLLKTDDKNTVELFQIWLNLPQKNKMKDPHFTMLWSEKIPVYKSAPDEAEVTVIAGEYNHLRAENPPPNSWAADHKNEVLILLIKLPKNKKFNLPLTNSNSHRAVYFFEGEELKLNSETLNAKTGALVKPNENLELTALTGDCEILILQAAKINEPVAQHGPFVMNTNQEIHQAIADYQNTGFGGWNWPRQDMVHGSALERFAKYPDGRVEKPN